MTLKQRKRERETAKQINRRKDRDTDNDTETHTHLDTDKQTDREWDKRNLEIENAFLGLLTSKGGSKDRKINYIWRYIKH